MAIWRTLPDRLGNRFSSPRKQRSRKAAGLAARTLRMEPFEERAMLAIGPNLVAVFPDASETTGLANNQVLHVAPTQLIFRFDSNLDPTTIAAGALSSIVVKRAGPDHALGTADDVTVQAGFVGPGPTANEVVVRFANDLPNDSYQYTISPTLKGINGGTFNGGQPLTQLFSLDLGAQVVSIVPQPVSRDSTGKLTQSANEIDVYFNSNDPLDVTSAQTKTFYELIRTNGTATTLDDGSIFNPISVTYSQTSGKAILMFAPGVLSVAGSYRLRIGNSDPLSLPSTSTTVGSGVAGSSFGTADNLQTLFTAATGTQSLTISGAGAKIGGSPVTVLYPGGDNEPGTRNINVEDHLNGAPDLSGQIPVYFYNFQSAIGSVNGTPQSNVITEVQKQRVREVLQYYSNYLGVEFVETADQGFIIARGNPLVVDPNVNPLGIGGIAGGGEAVMNSFVDWGDSLPGGSFFQTAMHEIGHLLGLGHTYELPALTIQGSAETQSGASPAEPVFPGDADILLGQYLHPPVGNDINVYQFSLNQAGLLNLETIAERLGQVSNQDPSQLNTVITLFDSNGNIISRNDDYYGKDSLVSTLLTAGTYYVAVTSTGNTNFNPAIANTGFGGTTQGSYQLRMTFTPSNLTGIKDTTGTLLDGDADGTPGGLYNFWFNVAPTNQTIFVDKITGVDLAAAGAGSLTAPYKTIAFALAHAAPGSVVRIEGNFGPTNNPNTPVTGWQSYNIGFDSLGRPLSDGSTFQVPQGVTVMVDAGAVIKLQGANIDVGSVTPNTAAGGALQLLGTPTSSVYVTSYYNNAFGTDPGTAKGPLRSGDWGGIVFHNDADHEDAGIFVDYINHANISYGGGQVSVNSVLNVYDPIYLIASRPTITDNIISNSAAAAVSADPNSFEESEFESTVAGSAFAADYSRVGPQVRGNSLSSNSINGLFVRIRTDLVSGSVLDALSVSARFSTTDMVYVIEENLEIQGQPGGFQYINQITGLVSDSSDPNARLTDRGNARLAIDPGVTIKLGGARIETQIGSQLIAEGTSSNPITFTSVFDDRYGAAGSFDTTNDGSTTTAAAGNWGGLFFGPTSTGSVDHALITFGGGKTTVEGGFGTFDAVEIHQAKVRIANSTLENNAAGGDPSDRSGRSSASSAVIFVRGAQPVIVNNTIQNNDLAGANPNTAAISINVNSLNSQLVTDWGDSIGAINLQVVSLTNEGPLVRGNRLSNNPINGMLVRGGTVTTNVVWDDTDIVHVLEDLVTTSNQFSLTGTVRLQSSSTESLVIKLLGATAGFTASGTPLDISDRYGGSVQILGASNHPVVMTSLYDTTAGAGFTPAGQPQNDTANRKGATTPAPTPGDWAGVTLDTYSNDTNLDVVNETEQGFVSAADTNSTPTTAQYLGILAKDSKSGDDNARLGFTIHGSISQTFQSAGRGDVDVYSFQGTAGSTVWFDLNQTASSLDSVVELVDSNGAVLARSDNAQAELANNSLLVGLAKPMQISFNGVPGPFTAPHFFSTNPLDGGMRVDLPGTTGTINTYYVRVRASNLSTNMSDLGAGLTKGEYQLQIRLQDEYQYPGSVVRNSDIRYSTNAVQVIGKPEHSPLQGDTAQTVATQPSVTAATGGGANVIEGETFTLNMRTNVGNVSAGTTFTLTKDSNKSGPTFILINNTMTSADVATAIANKVGTSVAGVTAQLLGTTTVQFVGATNLTQSTVHSLIGNQGPNNSFDTAQDLGNLLATSNNELSVAGQLTPSQTVSWFKFDVNYDLVQAIANSSDGLKTFAAMFAINYADGLARPDTTLSIFDSSGNLILIGRDSQIPDAQPTPTLGADTSNTAHGNFGSLDPTIGSVQIPAGGPNPTNSPTGKRTYYVAVSSSLNLPTVLDATFKATATNPLIRLEPIDSLSRVVDDHIGSGDSTSTASTPAQVFPGSTPAQLNLSATPLTLGDVVMYVTDDSDLYTINPFTGQVETIITGSGNQVQPTQYNTASGSSQLGLPHSVPGDFTNIYNDLAMRSDGRLMAFPTGLGSAFTNVTNGTYRQINTTDGSLATTLQGGLGDQSVAPISTSIVDKGGPNSITTGGYSFTNSGVDRGVAINGMTFGSNNSVTVGGRALFAVGNRGDFSPFNMPDGITEAQNLLFAFDPNTGAPLFTESDATNGKLTIYGQAGGSPAGPGSGTSAIPQGTLTTGVSIIAVPATDNPSTGKPNPDNDIVNGRQIRIGNAAPFAFGTNPLNTISHPAGTTFQFDSSTATNGGGTLNFPQTVDSGLSVTYSPQPAAGIVLGAAGTSFTIGGTTFRFVDPTGTVTPSEIPVRIPNTLITADQLGAAIVQAVNSVAGIGGTATAIPGLSGVASYSVHRLTFNTSLPINFSNLTALGFSIDPRPTVPTGVIRIPFFAAESASQMATSLRNAINNASIHDPSGSVGFVRATINQGFTQGKDGTQAIFSVQLTGVLGSDLNLNSNVGGNTLAVTGAFDDTLHPFSGLNGQTFTITDGQRHTLVFQFGSPSNGNIAVAIPPSGSAVSDVAISMAAAINQQAALGKLQVTATANGSNVTLVGNLADTTRGVDLGTLGSFPTLFGTNGAVRTPLNPLVTDAPENNLYGQSNTQGPQVVDTYFGNNVFFNSQQGDITGVAFVPTPATALGSRQDRLFAVSDTGALYEIKNFNGTDSATMTLLDVVSDKTGGPASNKLNINPTEGLVNFTGLTVGPPDVENGAYKYTLFATDTDGNIWTFDVSPDTTTGQTLPTSGQLSHVFLDGATHIQTPLIGATGVTFSSLDFNLWHATTQPTGTNALPGHGTNASFDFNLPRDLAPGPQVGGTSFYFGLDDPRTTPGQPAAVNDYLLSGNAKSGNPALFNSYNLPGGAYGSLTAQPFSLQGYSAADKPTLYFNYALDTQDTDALNGGMRDSFRVYASTDGVNWTELVTNDSVLSAATSPNAELPSYLSAAGGQYKGDKPNQQVQEAFDPKGNPAGGVGTPADPGNLSQDQNTTAIGWRQARVDLGDFAGKSNITLRFDFSSAGSMGVGANLQGGAYLSALPGKQLTDGSAFVVDNAIQVATAPDGFTPVLATTNYTFTFRSGFVLTTPVGGGAAIQEGEKFTANGTTFTFTKTSASGPGIIHINNSMTPADVAKAIQATILVQPLTLLAAPGGGAAVQEGETFTVNGTTFQLTKTNTFVPGNVPVAISNTMDAAGVAGAINTALVANTLGITPSPGGGSIVVDGESFTVNGTTFTFSKFGAVGPNIIDITNNMSDVQVAAAISAALQAQPLVITAPAGGGAAVIDGETLTVNGSTYTLSKAATTGALIVNITDGMTANQVAAAIVAKAGGVATGADVQFAGAATLSQSTNHSLSLHGLLAGVTPELIGPNVQFVGAATVTLSANTTFLQHGTLASFVPTLSGSTIVLNGATAISQSGVRSVFLAGLGGISPVVSGTSVQLVGANTLTQTPAPGQASPAMIKSGSALPGTINTTDVLYTIDMSAGDVSIQMAKAMDATFAIANSNPANVNAAKNTDDPTIFTSSKVVYTASADGLSQVPSGVLRIFGRDSSANQYNSYLGHNVISPGPLPYSATLPGDNSGQLYTPLARTSAFGVTALLGNSSPAKQRAQNNFHEGVYVDDIMVGFAGRGEMVTGLNNPVTDLLAGGVGITGITTFTPVPTDPDPRVPKPISFGIFQLDIRPATEYAAPGSSAFPFISLINTFDINDRLAQGFTLFALPAQQSLQNSTFQIVTEMGVYTFQFVTNASPNVSSTNGVPNIAVTIHDGDSAATVAASIASAINNVPVAKKFNVKASALGTSNRVNLFGDAQLVLPGPLGLTTFGGGPLGDTPVGGLGGSIGGLGDTTPIRPQGETIIQNNRISNSKNAGILVTPQITYDANGNPIAVGVPGHTGSVANLVSVNTPQLVSGMSFSNNLITDSGSYGILFSGAPTTDIPHAVPFGRIFNNTIVGAPIGIDVLNNASPTILNNIIVKTLTAILVDLTSSTTVVGESVYQSNGANLTGVSETNPIFLQPNAPLFVDATKGNYYLVEGSLAIDSSVNTLPDRPQMVAVNSPLGIPPSPIQAPNVDLLGQLRVDDPLVSSPPGLGSNIFKDRGAIERADFAGPTAMLLNPLDNDAAGVDRNALNNQVLIVGKQLTNFAIQLSDNGVGVDDSTVDVSKFVITRNGVALVPGADYTLSYDTTNNIAQLVPAAGVWADGTYVIRINNTNSASPIKDLASNGVQPNDATGVTQFVIQQSAVVAPSWQNPINKFDVNHDGFISGLDALLIIDSLLTQGPRPLPGVPTVPPDFYYDINGDGFLSPQDLLTVVQYLNVFGVTPAATVAAAPAATPQAAPAATPAAVAPPAATSAATVADASGSAVAFSLAVAGSSSTTSASASPLAASVSTSSTGGTTSAASGSATQSGIASAALATTLSSEDWSDTADDLDSILTDLTTDTRDPRLSVLGN